MVGSVYEKRGRVAITRRGKNTPLIFFCRLFKKFKKGGIDYQSCTTTKKNESVAQLLPGSARGEEHNPSLILVQGSQGRTGDTMSDMMDANIIPDRVNQSSWHGKEA